MKKNIKFVSLLSIFTLVFNIFAVLIFLKPVGALSGVSDTLSTYEPDTVATNTLAFTTTTTNPGDVIITFPAAFTGTATEGYPNCVVTTTSPNPTVVTCTLADAGLQEVIISGLVNPANAGTYLVNVHADGVDVNDEVFIGLYNQWDYLTSRTPSAASTHTIDFVTASTTATITFPSDFTGTATASACTITTTSPDPTVIDCTGLTPGFHRIDVWGLTNPIAGNYYVTVDAATESSDITVDITNTSFSLSTYLSGAYSTTIVSYDFVETPTTGQTFNMDFPNSSDYSDENFYCEGLVVGDVSLTSGTDWSVTSADDTTCLVTLTAGSTPSDSIEVTVDNTHLRNPTYLQEYSLLLNGSVEPTSLALPRIAIVEGSGLGSDTLSDYNAGAYSSHTITYEFGIAPAWTQTDIEITTTLPSGFNCTGLEDADVSAGAGVVGWTFTVPTADTCEIVATNADENGDPSGGSNPLSFTISSTHVRNPMISNTYDAIIDGTGSFEPTNLELSIIITGGGTPGSGSDVMSRSKAGELSSHEITYNFGIDPLEGETFTINFQDLNDNPKGFDCTGLVNADVTPSSGWLLNGSGPANAVDPDSCEIFIIADETPSNPIVVSIASTHMLNPDESGSYSLYLTGEFSDITIQVAIVDSDEVLVSGFINANIMFDIDTTTEDSGSNYPECDSTTCLDYEGGSVMSNYTVDLGNLTLDTPLNKSGQSVLHSDGETGVINSIYFDLSTNAASGAVVTYRSLYGELRGPGHSNTIASDLDIPTTDGLTDITFGVKGYGIQLTSEPSYENAGSGTRTVNCGKGVIDDYYCVMGIIEADTGVNLQGPLPIYSTTGTIELARGRIDVAAAINGTNVPGSYTDQLTFIATATF